MGVPSSDVLVLVTRYFVAMSFAVHNDLSDLHLKKEPIRRAIASEADVVVPAVQVVLSPSSGTTTSMTALLSTATQSEADLAAAALSPHFATPAALTAFLSKADVSVASTKRS